MIDQLDYQPVFLIGAARSGTKIVRDIIARHPEISKVPYDINYTWRLGNEDFPHDEMPPELLDNDKREKLRNEISLFNKGTPLLIEKTVSNCLRIPFVNSVFPEAKYIFLVRDGYDTIESVYRQWLAAPDWDYIFKKMFAFPLFESFKYAFSYARQTFLRLFTRDQKKLGSWGPHYQGIDEDIASKTLIEVCAIQWARSVQKAWCDLDKLSPNKVLLIRYHNFVKLPLEQLFLIAQFLGVNPSAYTRLDLEDLISIQNLRKGYKHLDECKIKIINPYIEEISPLFSTHGTHSLTSVPSSMYEAN